MRRGVSNARVFPHIILRRAESRVYDNGSLVEFRPQNVPRFVPHEGLLAQLLRYGMRALEEVLGCVVSRPASLLF